jgi:bacteriochlorophyll 4-vinyl reductase
VGWTHSDRPSGSSARMGAATLQGLGRALSSVRGETEARRIFALRGFERVWDEPPRDAVREEDFLSLLGFLVDSLPRSEALDVARRAGQGAGAWLIQARIPVPARFMLQSLPGRIAFPLLLRTLEVHGWTLVGGGQFAQDPGHPRGLRLVHGPGARAFPDPAVLHAYFLGALEPLFTFFLGPDLQVVIRDALPPREGIALLLREGAGVRP